ncbi:MAG TPA: polymorphic toxin-type HINT domain-containing protein [Polyangia bacterium]
MADIRGSHTIEKIVIIGVFIFGAVSGVRYVSSGSEITLGRQAQCIGTNTFNCAGGKDVTEPAVTDPGNPAAPGRTCTGSACMCFVAGTLVATRDGLQPIENITPGTEVLSRPETGTGEVAWKPVVQTFVSTSRSLVRLTTLDHLGRQETFDTTGNHPFQVEGRGWLEARVLIPGRDLLVNADGQPARLLKAESLDQQVPVYNFEVADFRTYFVGHSQIWVHNRQAALGDTISVERAGKREPARVFRTFRNGLYLVRGRERDGRAFTMQVNHRGERVPK